MVKGRLLEFTMIKIKISSLTSILTVAFVCAPLLTQAANPYQSRNTNYGVSGSNVKDITSAFCCGGTLGSLLTSGTTLYILSNNHILARQDQASPGENISQPGLIDNGCQPATTVAHYSTAPKLGSNVDAAIAQLISGQMNSTGSIQGIGTISSVVKAPAVGLAVEKSGRTTGTTTGTIGSTNTSVNVQYQIRCGQGKKYTISYTNQIVINSSSFSAGGDPGSTSTSTVAQPSGGQGLELPQQAIDHAGRILEQNRHDLMSKPGVLGVGLGALEDNSQAAVIVYVDKTSSAKPELPERVDNVPVRVIFTDPFIAY
ncbi:MAG: hypothetical protein DME85_00420 [Verrucomicrobia bacterium]|nr:MAG: hypothetical protein DME85_00420 [Verrucomicrobiota bacterium]